MTRKLGLCIVALATIGMCAVTADTAEAFGRRHRNHGSDGGGGSWGGNGGSWGGNGGSWGGNGGSFGGNGSWGGNGSHGGGFLGGLFNRRNGGSRGSAGGYSNGSCGSHGGYSNGYHEGEVIHEGKVIQEGEVRYYGTREYDSGETVEPAPAAPAMENNADRPADQQTFNDNAPQTSAPQTGGPQNQGANQSSAPAGESTRDVTTDRPAPPEERLRPQTGEANPQQ